MLSYYLLAPILFLLARIPTRTLYRLADGLAWILRVVIRYRRPVVIRNLSHSFPHKSEEEINRLAKEFYTHLSDKVVENIRCIGISKNEVEERMLVKNPELLSQLHAQGRHVVLMIAHIAAWEFGTFRLSDVCRYKLFGLVSRVKNPYFNSMIQRTRGKMGMELIFMDESKEFFRRALSTPSAVAFISDQSPSNPRRAYWATFLNQPTAFFTGGEGYARLHDCVVLYAKIVQRSRGHYEGEFIQITDQPNSLPENEITERYVRLLEKHISENPSDWLWSHKRWKHQPPQENHSTLS